MLYVPVSQNYYFTFLKTIILYRSSPGSRSSLAKYHSIFNVIAVENVTRIIRINLSDEEWLLVNSLNGDQMLLAPPCDENEYRGLRWNVAFWSLQINFLNLTGSESPELLCWLLLPGLGDSFPCRTGNPSNESDWTHPAWHGGNVTGMASEY